MLFAPILGYFVRLWDLYALGEGALEYFGHVWMRPHQAMTLVRYLTAGILVLLSVVMTPELLSVLLLWHVGVVLRIDPVLIGIQDVAVLWAKDYLVAEGVPSLSNHLVADLCEVVEE